MHGCHGSPILCVRYVNTATRFWCFPDLDMYHDEATHNDKEEWEVPEQEDNAIDINEVRMAWCGK